MKSKKTLAILLAVMMILSSVPMFASAAETLKAANVESYPTISYKSADGKFYYGQTVSEVLIINDDEVVKDANGNVVDGRFVFHNENLVASQSGTLKVNMKFVPADETAYTGFTKLFSPVTYNVEKGTMKLVDEVNDPPVTTGTQPSGTPLSEIEISGGAVVNVLSDASNANRYINDWKWEDPTIVPTESGYFNAIRTGEYFANEIVYSVYVDVAQNTVNTTIAEAPTVGELAYDASRTWADVELTGGKAVEEGTGTEVAGTFAVTKVNGIANLNKIVNDGDIAEITFTPADTGKYYSSTTTITVTVNKAVLKFRDENGNEVVPEYTIPYGYALNNYQAGIFEECKKYLNTGDENIRLYFSEADSKTMFPVGTHELTIGAAPYYTTSNYLKNDDLKVKITVEPKTLNPKISSSTEGYYVVDSSAVYKPKGTFDVYVNDELIASDVAYNSGRIKWEATESGTYVMKFVYNPVENDSFIIDDVTTTIEVTVSNTITYTTYNTVNAYILIGNNKRELFEKTNRVPGTTVTIGTQIEQERFDTWVITDANGNAVDLGIEDLTATEITFTMPDYDISIEAKTKSSSDSTGGGLEMPDLGDLELPELELDTDGDHKFKFVNIIQNLIEMLKNFIKQIGQTIEGIL